MLIAQNLSSESLQKTMILFQIGQDRSSILHSINFWFVNNTTKNF